MESTMDIPNSDGEQRPSKRIRRPTQPYMAGPANQADDYLLEEEERMLAQAIANSRNDRGIETNMVSSIPFGPTFYPTVEEFSGDPLAYLETIRSEAEKYGELFWKISLPLLLIGTFRQRHQSLTVRWRSIPMTLFVRRYLQDRAPQR